MLDQTKVLRVRKTEIAIFAMHVGSLETTLTVPLILLLI